MSPTVPGGGIEALPEEFERQARLLLEDSVMRLDGRIRSRLNLARHAAVEQASRGRPMFWRRFAFMPAASAVAAAVLVAFVLWPHSLQHVGEPVVAENGRPTMEDLDLLADSDALDLVSDETDGGQFYEWAAEQTDSKKADSSETST